MVADDADLHVVRGELLAATAFGLAFGAALGTLVEFVFIRPLYRRPIEQVLVTVGLALSLGALVFGIWGADPQIFPVPGWMVDTTTILGANIPNDRFVEIAVAVSFSSASSRSYASRARG